MRVTILRSKIKDRLCLKAKPDDLGILTRFPAPPLPLTAPLPVSAMSQRSFIVFCLRRFELHRFLRWCELIGSGSLSRCRLGDGCGDLPGSGFHLPRLQGEIQARQSAVGRLRNFAQSHQLLCMRHAFRFSRQRQYSQILSCFRFARAAGDPLRNSRRRTSRRASDHHRWTRRDLTLAARGIPAA